MISIHISHIFVITWPTDFEWWFVVLASLNENTRFRTNKRKRKCGKKKLFAQHKVKRAEPHQHLLQWRWTHTFHTYSRCGGTARKCVFLGLCQKLNLNYEILYLHLIWWSYRIDEKVSIEKSVIPKIDLNINWHGMDNVWIENWLKLSEISRKMSKKFYHTLAPLFNLIFIKHDFSWIISWIVCLISFFMQAIYHLYT